jgi:hypothetical protein
MILGEYDRHVDASSEFITNVFLTDGSHPHSPMLFLSILEVLAGLKNQAGANADEGYMAVSDMINYFEPCRIEADDLREAAKALLKRRLVEPLEPDRDEYSDALKIGITHAGEAHQEMAYGDKVYAEQMAMTTGVRLESVRARLLSCSKNMTDREARDTLLKTFLAYNVEEDARKVEIPPAANYAAQRKIRSELQGRRI